MTRNRRFLLAGLLLALVLAGIASYYASSAPDGLEKVAADKGVAAQQQDHALRDSPLAGYGDGSRLSGGLAGVIGVAITFTVGGALFVVLRRRTKAPSER